MSLIIHRCTRCQHPDVFHKGTDCSHNQCASGRHEPEYGDPEVLLTWRPGTGDVVESLAEPGSTFRGFGLIPQEMCGCEACHRLYADHDGVAS